ncbi:hypothetical protein [Paractinoplanes atraurantiacus]|uniref:Uncharacterized protein n=1 Tax=Paractinoplanes atraurantiacus TaxID=1036182 RepID=A0A285KE79_9ACTN|nr:hypothetical protein [Actinoplanes atraurantiacus]SNY70934.1 hypothetical protein SAMN05421748_13894 [Actinoplanes atraurantiacus]
MVKTFGGTAVALSLGIVVLSGCSSDSPPPAAAAPAPAAPLAAATSSVTAAAPPPGTAAPAPVSSPPAPVAGQSTSAAAPTATPSRPAGVHVPNVGGIQPGWVNGKVTGVSGSCLTVKDDTGVTWSLYSAGAVPVTAGTAIRARVNPGPTKINCGKGQPGTLVRAMVAGS